MKKIKQIISLYFKENMRKSLLFRIFIYSSIIIHGFFVFYFSTILLKILLWEINTLIYFS